MWKYDSKRVGKQTLNFRTPPCWFLEYKCVLLLTHWNGFIPEFFPLGSGAERHGQWGVNIKLMLLKTSNPDASENSSDETRFQRKVRLDALDWIEGRKKKKKKKSLLLKCFILFIISSIRTVTRRYIKLRLNVQRILIDVDSCQIWPRWTVYSCSWSPCRPPRCKCDTSPSTQTLFPHSSFFVFAQINEKHQTDSVPVTLL